MKIALPTDAPEAAGLPPASMQEINAARFYEHSLLPALFSQYAPRVVAAGGIRAGHRVLDVACGTGVVSREAATVTGDAALVTGIDISPGMLTVARDACPTLDWRPGDATDLPFADAVFDRVVCQFGLMFFSDPVKALEEMLRVLKPGGRIAVAVWDSISTAPCSAGMYEVLERMAGTRAAEAIRQPYRLGAIAQLEGLAQAAGMREFEIRTHAGEARFPDLRVLMDAEIRGWLPIMGVHLDEPLIEAIEHECARRLGEWIDADGALRIPTSAHILAAFAEGG